MTIFNNKQQTKKVETKIMLNTRPVHGPSAILELHVQSVRGQNSLVTRLMTVSLTCILDWPQCMPW